MRVIGKPLEGWTESVSEPKKPLEGCGLELGEPQRAQAIVKNPSAEVFCSSFLAGAIGRE